MIFDVKKDTMKIFKQPKDAEYVLLCNFDGEFKIHTEANSLKELIGKLNDIVNDIEKKIGKRK